MTQEQAERKSRQSGYLAAEVRCPYFRSYGGQRIICEGCISSSNLDITTFSSDRKMRDYLERVCSRNYEQCSKYGAVCEKYALREWHNIKEWPNG